MAVLGTPSSSASSRIFFSATIWFVLTSRALYTTPYVPVRRAASAEQRTPSVVMMMMMLMMAAVAAAAGAFV